MGGDKCNIPGIRTSKYKDPEMEENVSIPEIAK